MFGSIFGSVLGSIAGSATSSLLGGGSSGGSSGGSGFSMTDLIGPALQVGGSLLGGHLKSESTEKVNAHNLRLARDQFEWQRQYAHNRLQWAVEDAKKAGLHPMVAAGLSPVSFSPVSANLSPVDYDWVGEAGQSLAYAANKAKTNKQQQQAFDFQVKLGNEQLNSVRLDNELKVMQILGMASQLRNSGPAAPDLNGGNNLVGGQGDSPSPRTGLRSPEKSAYHVWDMGDGNFDILMNPDYQQTIGDEFGQVATTLKAITRAKQGVWVNPEDGVSYVYDANTGYFRRLSSLSDEEARRLLGSGSTRTSGPSPSHRERNKYRYR